MLLRDVAHSRTGDKGNTSNISVIAHDPADFGFLRTFLTPERVKAYFGPVAQGEVLRYEVAHLHALNFVIHNALAGGVTRSLALDAHGKCLSAVLLALPLPDQAPVRGLSRAAGMSKPTPALETP